MKRIISPDEFQGQKYLVIVFETTRYASRGYEANEPDYSTEISTPEIHVTTDIEDLKRFIQMCIERNDKYLVLDVKQLAAKQKIEILLTAN